MVISLEYWYLPVFIMIFCIHAKSTLVSSTSSRSFIFLFYYVCPHIFLNLMERLFSDKHKFCREWCKRFFDGVPLAWSVFTRRVKPPTPLGSPPPPSLLPPPSSPPPSPPSPPLRIKDGINLALFPCMWAG